MIVMKDVWSSLWPVINVKFSMLGRLLTSSGQDGTITKVTLKNGQGATCMQQHLFKYFVPLAIAAF